MDNRTLYTAIGYLKKKNEGFGQTYPVILVNRQEYLMDMQEMTVWTALCWRLMDYPNCPFVLYVGTRKLVKRKEFEEYIRREISI